MVGLSVLTYTFFLIWRFMKLNPNYELDARLVGPFFSLEDGD